MTHANDNDRARLHDAALWLRGGLAMAGDAFNGAVHLVNGVHRSVIHGLRRVHPVAAPLGSPSDFVYARVRDVGRLSFFAARQAAGLSETLLPPRAADIPARVSLGLRSALNGAFGDYLERSENELALSMTLVDCDGQALSLTHSALAGSLRDPAARLVILVHGLGMNDQQWRQGGRADFGERLAADLGYKALRLRYNSGRHISENGRELADTLEKLYRAYPVALERITLIGHSMGGLVARSACHYAAEAGHAWLERLRDMVCLGSPHLGAPLERLGNRFTLSLTRTPYTRPFAALGDIRSAGVKDLRYGYVRDEDWQKDQDDEPTPARPPSLPAHVGTYLVAATLGRRDDDPLGRLLGDMLVPVASAVGHSRLSSRRLADREQDGRVFYGMNHFALIYHDDVYAAIVDWLTGRLGENASRAIRSNTRRH